MLATLVIALGLNPVRVRLQRAVDRAIYGDRADPARVLSRMGERLQERPEPDGVLAVMADALRLPYLALRRGGIATTEHGTAPALTEAIPLRYRGEDVGELEVGARTGQAALDRADRAVLGLLAVPLAAVVHATALEEAVQHSPEQLVGAREEERRRLRRDLGGRRCGRRSPKCRMCSCSTSRCPTWTSRGGGEIVRSAPTVAVLILTMFDDDSVFAAMRAGARGYLLKGATQDEIVRAIHAVAGGDRRFGARSGHFRPPLHPTDDHRVWASVAVRRRSGGPPPRRAA